MSWDKIEQHLFDKYCVEGEDKEFCRLQKEHDTEVVNKVIDNLIDEHIECAKTLAKVYRKQFLFSYAEKQDELAMLLEELKCYRNNNDFNKYTDKLYNYAYDKAIDDFVEYANEIPCVETEDGEIRPMRLEEMAEVLKKRSKNES